MNSKDVINAINREALDAYKIKRLAKDLDQIKADEFKLGMERCVRNLNPNRLLPNPSREIRNMSVKYFAVVENRQQILKNMRHNDDLLNFYIKYYKAKVLNAAQKEYPTLKHVLKEIGETSRADKTRIGQLEALNRKLEEDFTSLVEYIKAEGRELMDKEKGTS